MINSGDQTNDRKSKVDWPVLFKALHKQDKTRVSESFTSTFFCFQIQEPPWPSIADAILEEKSLQKLKKVNLMFCGQIENLIHIPYCTENMEDFHTF